VVRKIIKTRIIKANINVAPNKGLQPPIRTSAALNIFYELSKPNHNRGYRKIILLCFSIFFFFLLYHFSERSYVGFDYLAYQNSAEAILRHQSSYITNPPYIYPPLVAQSLALAFRSVRWVLANFPRIHLYKNLIFHIVFYLYQCIQLLLTNLCFFLSYKFASYLTL
jgi:hypothetical protein